MAPFVLNREREIAKSADEVWEYLSDFRNTMTLNQFHESVDCDSVDVENPKPGLVIPIRHNILGGRHTRYARITKYEDYSLSWGERVAEGQIDTFPHSEGWTVIPVDKNHCVVRNHLRAGYRHPLGKLLSPYLRDTVFVDILDHDLHGLAVALGAARPQPRPFTVPPMMAAMMKLAAAQTIDGVPVAEYFAGMPGFDEADSGLDDVATDPSETSGQS